MSNQLSIANSVMILAVPQCFMKTVMVAGVAFATDTSQVKSGVSSVVRISRGNFRPMPNFSVVRFAKMPVTVQDLKFDITRDISKVKKKLIEIALPLEDINRESAREKSIRHGHPSTLHLWWARRPLASARAVLFASIVDDPSSHPDKFPTEEDQKRERAPVRYYP